MAPRSRSHITLSLIGISVFSAKISLCIEFFWGALMKRCCRDVQSICVIDCRPYGERLKKMLTATVIVRPIVVSFGVVPDVIGKDGSLESSLNH